MHGTATQQHDQRRRPVCEATPTFRWTSGHENMIRTTRHSESPRSPVGFGDELRICLTNSNGPPWQSHAECHGHLFCDDDARPRSPRALPMHSEIGKTHRECRAEKCQRRPATPPRPRRRRVRTVRTESIECSKSTCRPRRTLRRTPDHNHNHPAAGPLIVSSPITQERPLTTDSATIAVKTRNRGNRAGDRNPQTKRQRDQKYRKEPE